MTDIEKPAEPRAADPERPEPKRAEAKRPEPKRAEPKRPEPKRAEPKRPYHVGVAVGLTTSVYAATLLLATRLQIESDRALIADRDPVQAAIHALGNHHDSLTDLLEQSREQYNAAVGGYNSVVASLDQLDERLASVNGTIQAVERLGASISTSLALPAIPNRGSGGGTVSSSRGSGGGGGTTSKPPAAAPPPAPPPPTSGSTGASGAP
jgi:hypothetical protein